MERLPALIVVCSILNIVCLIEYQQMYLFSFFKHIKRTESLNLGLCILSSREHFERRQVIRDTWLNLTAQDAPRSYKAMFVVGNGCAIHPSNRLDAYSCDRWHLNTTIVGDVVYAFQEHPGAGVLTPVAVGRLSVKVLHSVTLRRLGISERLLNFTDFQKISVTVFDGFTEDELVTVTFSETDSGVIQGGYYYQPIQPLLLPTGYECELSIDEFYGVNPLSKNWNLLMGEVTMNGVGIILIAGMNEDRTYIKNYETQSLISFMFTVENKLELQEHETKEKEKDKVWQQEQSNTNKNLIKEIVEFGDIILADLTDVYRSLPTKILACHQWFHDNWDVKFMMKTDDDCYVDLDQILSNLPTQTSSKLWWGNFRSDWLVERHGKWTEGEYTSSVYPKFACGSGNVISSDIHHWLVRNKDDLFKYQGEDTSMGIWLSSIGVEYVQSYRWMCNATCDTSTMPLVVPELSSGELWIYWRNKEQCGNPCHCDQ